MEDDLNPLSTWIGATEAIQVIDEASVSLVRERVRAEGTQVGLGAVQTAALVNVASELAHNQLAHARSGFVVVRATARGDERGLEVVAADLGPGIPDVACALEGRTHGPHGAARTQRSLGVGLAAVSELADELDIDVRLGEGTCIWARKFNGVATRRPRVGVFGRAYPGERRSGDDAAFVRKDGALLACVVDGLGHGDAAREASVRAARRLGACGDVAPQSLLAECDRELAGTRGAVMAAARLDDGLHLSVAGVGNVAVSAYGPGTAWRFGGSSFVLGTPGRARRIAVEERPLARWDVLLLFTDGLRSGLDLSGDLDLLREHPAIVAQRAVERFSRPDDDVLVMAIG